MVWNALLQSASFTSLALIPTTVDRFVVWGALALVIGMVAWRELTLPEVALPLPAPGSGAATPLPEAAPSGMAESRPVV